MSEKPTPGRSRDAAVLDNETFLDNLHLVIHRIGERQQAREEAAREQAV
jgi:hypothetical protein